MKTILTKLSFFSVAALAVCFQSAFAEPTLLINEYKIPKINADTCDFSGEHAAYGISLEPICRLRGSKRLANLKPLERLYGQTVNGIDTDDLVVVEVAPGLECVVRFKLLPTLKDGHYLTFGFRADSSAVTTGFEPNILARDCLERSKAALESAEIKIYTQMIKFR